jgi:4-amino-4-deoxy-L-arabinose transferase-like glycosyltransferase
MKLPRFFWAILFFSLVLRLGAAYLAPHPGISDSNHYYNMARNLAEGRGFVIDYIWNYYTKPADVTHPEDYWMPLPAVYPAVMLHFFPDNLFMALLPSVAFGVAVVVLTYGLAGSMGLSTTGRLLAMGLVAFIPEFVLNSARTDTTMSYVFYMGCLFWCFYKGFTQHGKWWILAGVFAGLAHLTRQDTILVLPSVLLSVIVLWRLKEKIAWGWLMGFFVAWVLVLTPWMLRNYELFGVLLSGGSSRTIFMTSFIDQFTYGRELNLEHWLAWGWGNIISNILTMVLANIRMLTTLPDVFLPIVALVGLGILIQQRDAQKIKFMLFPFVLVLALFMFYSFVTPFHTQGGSFKKSVMLVLPFIACLGAFGVLSISKTERMAGALCVVSMLLMAMNAFQLIRTDFDVARRFNQSIIDLSVRLDELGDVNSDGEIIVMTQDPFILNYHGYRALMIPSDSRDMILEASYAYQVDYILLPAARVSLDNLYHQQESDVRLVWHEGTGNYQLLEVKPKP